MTRQTPQLPENQPPRSQDPPPWPPNWARSVGLATGIGLTIYESVVGGGDNYLAYAFAFLLTGLPILRGFEKLLDKIPWGSPR